MVYDISTLGRWCVRLTWAYFVVSLISLPLLYWEITIIERYQTGVLVGTEAEVTRFDSFTPVFYVIYVLVLLLSMVLSAVWIYRASANSGAVDPVTTRITPIWSVAWWAIPIANLWMPFKAVKQIWNSSMRTDIELDPAPGFFAIWWTCWVISDILGNISFRLSMREDDMDSYLTTIWLDMAAAPLSAGAALLWVRILREVTEAQTDGRGTEEIFA